MQDSINCCIEVHCHDDLKYIVYENHKEEGQSSYDEILEVDCSFFIIERNVKSLVVDNNKNVTLKNTKDISNKQHLQKEVDIINNQIETELFDVEYHFNNICNKLEINRILEKCCTPNSKHININIITNSYVKFSHYILNIYVYFYCNTIIYKDLFNGIIKLLIHKHQIILFCEYLRSCKNIYKYYNKLKMKRY